MTKKKAKPPQPENEFIVHGRPSAEQLAWVTGMSFRALVDAIIENRDGKYDALYGKEAGRCPSAITASTS